MFVCRSKEGKENVVRGREGEEKKESRKVLAYMCNLSSVNTTSQLRTQPSFIFFRSFINPFIHLLFFTRHLLLISSFFTLFSSVFHYFVLGVDGSRVSSLLRSSDVRQFLRLRPGVFIYHVFVMLALRLLAVPILFDGAAPKKTAR